MVLAFERGMTSPMNILVVVVSRPINVKVANIGTVLWATVYIQVVPSFNSSSLGLIIKIVIVNY